MSRACSWCDAPAAQEVQIAEGSKKRMPKYVPACATHAQWIKVSGESTSLRERREHIARGQVTLEQILGEEKR